MLTEMDKLRQIMNNKKDGKYRGENRLKRPPVFCWAKSIVQCGTGRLSKAGNSFFIKQDHEDPIRKCEE